MGAGGFHGRVRDGIGCGPPAIATRSSNPPWPRGAGLGSVLVGLCMLIEAVCGGHPVVWMTAAHDGRLLAACANKTAIRSRAYRAIRTG